MKRLLYLFVTALCCHSLFSQITITPEQFTYSPLDEISVSVAKKGTIVFRDAKGQEYFRKPASGELHVMITGALGTHIIELVDKNGVVIDRSSFPVNCETGIIDKDSVWYNFHKKLYWNVFKSERTNGEAEYQRYRGKTYYFLSCWIRDNVHIMQGKKYYSTHLKDALDLYSENQAANGMIFDFFMNYGGPGSETRFKNRAFMKVSHEDNMFFERVPVENDVEFLFVQGIYQAWKATGDYEWMKSKLQNADRALRYNMTSEYCWSKKYNLLKRALCTDTWDFMPNDQAALVGGDVMEVIPGKTNFGVFHGDNTGFASSCRYLAEMYEAVGRPAEAKEWRNTGDQIMDRLNKLSWNGHFYTHWISEDESFVGDYGVDMKKQVSLSNTYALNRGISHEKAVAIINTYLNIKKELDSTAPAEFYSMYPPFAKGFVFKTWHYTNGGVFPFIGGELAHGAFENGYEKYGVDILQRLDQLLAKYDNQFPYYYVGKKEKEPKRSFEIIPLKTLANADVSGTGAKGVPGWEGRGTENDFSIMPSGRQRYYNVPFDVVDPAQNGRKCCLGLAAKKGYASEIKIPVKKKASSLYFLHTVAGSGHIAGWLTLKYADGTTYKKYVESNKEIKNWWYPTDVPYNRIDGWVCRVAFKGNNKATTVGNYIWGYNNPYPEKEISELIFTHSGMDNFWFVFGITLCDQPVWFEADDLLWGWFYNWNTSEVIYGLMEGLCGVYDQGVCFNKTMIAPRWSASSVKDVKVFVKYPESNGYASYRYTVNGKQIALDVATAANESTIKILLPENAQASAVRLNDANVTFQTETIEKSNYIVVPVKGIDAKRLVVDLK